MWAAWVLQREWQNEQGERGEIHRILTIYVGVFHNKQLFAYAHPQPCLNFVVVASCYAPLHELSWSWVHILVLVHVGASAFAIFCCFIDVQIHIYHMASTFLDFIFAIDGLGLCGVWAPPA
jgi:hypothetical protein